MCDPQHKGTCLAYGLNEDQVINAFNEVFPGGDYEDLKDAFADFNEQGCLLGRKEHDDDDDDHDDDHDGHGHDGGDHDRDRCNRDNKWHKRWGSWDHGNRGRGDRDNDRDQDKDHDRDNDRDNDRDRGRGRH